MYLRTVYTNPAGPNTTVLLPGPCNARCDFCFWNHEQGKLRPEPREYLQRVFHQLDRLPLGGSPLSISGGEPSISPYLQAFLVRLQKYRRTASGRISRVVLTSNGTKIQEQAAVIATAVDHLNISRHHWDDRQSERIFQNTGLPDTQHLKLLVELMDFLDGPDVTFNCVVQRENLTYEFARTYLDWAKTQVGVRSVSFRTVADTTEPSPAELRFRQEFGPGQENHCPVCRSHVQQALGMSIRWKGSVEEPSLETQGVYEHVIHPDGRTYADWQMRAPLSEVHVQELAKQVDLQQEELVAQAEARERHRIAEIRGRDAGRGGGCGGGCGGRGGGC